MGQLTVGSNPTSSASHIAGGPRLRFASAPTGWPLRGPEATLVASLLTFALTHGPVTLPAGAASASLRHPPTGLVGCAATLVHRLDVCRVGLVTGSDAAALDLEALMGLALAEAALALGHDDVPVGAVVVVDGKVVAARHNERERTGDPTAHAEVLALRDAAAALGRWRLDDATLVVTLEPCPMCAGAAVNSRLARIVYGAGDPKAGATGSLYNLCADARLNHEIAVTPFVRADESSDLLKEFFASRR